MDENLDLLKPELVWVGDRCYRSNNAAISGDTKSCLENDYLSDDADDESNESGIEILPHGASKFQHSFYVPKPLFPFIVGAKNATRKKLELETKTTVRIPRPHEDGDITIIGVNRRSIISARNRIDLLAETCRKRMRITHFLSIPLVKDVKSGYELFQEYVVKSCVGSCRNVDDTIMQKPYKLHLTIGTLLLLDDKERNEAAKVFNDCKEEVINPFLNQQRRPIVINIQGVDIMNDEPASASVLYGKVTSEDGRLQELGNEIVDYFAKSGLMKERTNNVKLHATFMNISFKAPDETKRFPKRETFDASKIIDKFKDTLFGTTILKEIHLSQCGTAVEDTYYEATAKITFDEQEV